MPTPVSQGSPSALSPETEFKEQPSTTRVQITSTFYTINLPEQTDIFAEATDTEHRALTFEKR